jgi:hypothetical protein
MHAVTEIISGAVEQDHEETDSRAAINNAVVYPTVDHHDAQQQRSRGGVTWQRPGELPWWS